MKRYHKIVKIAFICIFSLQMIVYGFMQTSYAETHGASINTNDNSTNSSVAQSGNLDNTPNLLQSPQQGDPTQNISLKVGTINSGKFSTNKTDFWTDEPVGAAVDMGISGYGVNIYNAKLKITVPKSEGIKKSLKFTDSVNAKLSEKTEDANNWYMTYTFDPLTGASAGTYALPFIFDSATTAENDEIKVKAELFDGDGKLLKSAEHIYKSKVHKMDSRLCVYGQKKYDKINNVYVYDAATTVGHPGITNPKDGAIIRFIDASVKLDMTNQDERGLGHPNPKNVEIVIYLPPEATVRDGILDNLWKYDKATNTLRVNIDKPNFVKGGSVSTDYCDGFGKALPYIIFKGAPIDKIYTLKAEYTVNKGEAGEYRLADRELRFKFEAMPFSQKGNIEVYKTGHGYSEYNNDPKLTGYEKGHNYYYMKSGRYFIGDHEFTNEGMRYETHIRAWHNSSGFEKPNEVKMGQIYDITTSISDERVHFVGFSAGFFVPNDTTPGWEARLQKAKDDFLKTPNKLYGVDKDGGMTEIAQNVKLFENGANRVKINDPSRKFVALKLVFDSPIELDNMSFGICDYVKLMPGEEAKWDNKENGKKQTYSGRSSVTATLKGVSMPKTVYDDGKDGKDGFLNVIPIYPLIAAYQSQNQNVVYETGGTQTPYIVGPDLRKGNWGTYKTAKNVKSVTLLPPGYNCGKDENNKAVPVFKEAQKAGKDGILTQWREFGESRIKVIENYKKTGRTAVIVDYGDVDYNQTRKVTLNIVATKQVRHGSGIVDNYYVYDDNNYIEPYTSGMKYTDKLDLDNDGDNKETFAQVKSELNFIPPYELILNKYAKLPNDNAAGVVANADLGGEVDYNISVYNQTIHTVKKFSVIDTMPTNGDHTIVENDQHKYPARGSSFSTPLRMALEDYAPNKEVMKLFDVFYQLSPQGKDLASVRDGEWLTKDQVSDFSKVKSFKLVLKSGQEIAAKKELIIAVPSRVPFNMKLNEKSDSAFNTAAMSTNSVDYLEGRAARVNFVTYGISGKVYYDANENGIFDSEDKPAKNVSITLVNKATGKTAVIPDGHNTPVTAVTDSEGNYRATVYDRGDYVVKYLLNSGNTEFNRNKTIGHGISEDDVNNKSGNSIVPESISADKRSAFSGDFKLNPANKKSVQNAALVGYNNLKITKTGMDGNRTERLKDVGFTLYRIEKENGKEKEVKIEECKTDQNGEYVFKRFKLGKYIVKETSAAPTYNNDNAEGKVIEVSDSTSEFRIDFTDTKIKGNIKVHKVDENGKPLKGVEFTIKQNDHIISRAVTDELGYAKFNDIAYGQYEVVESKGIKGYEVSKKVHQVEIKETGQVVEFEVVNKKTPYQPPENPPKDNPKKGKHTHPTTSDTLDLLEWGVLLTLSAVAFVAIVKRRRVNN